MVELGQQTVEFSTLVRRATEESFLSLKDLVEKSKDSNQLDSEKKISLLKYILKTRQRMLRLHVLAKWGDQAPLVHYCQQLASTLSSHDTCFTQAADSLFFMHEGLQQAHAPIYDVPSAIEVLTGTCQCLPKCIEDMGIQGTLTEDQQKPALRKLDTLLRSKLLEVALPKEISEVKVSDGTALLRVDREFKVLLTLGYRGHLSLWRILHLEFLVGERSGFVKLEESRRHALGDDLERRMAAAKNSFMILYSTLHGLCVALVMDTLTRQVQALCQGRWKDVIRFERIYNVRVGQGGNTGSIQIAQDGKADSAGRKTPGMKIIYWLDYDKITGVSDPGSSPFIHIEFGQDLQIKCRHNTFVIDPLTGKEAAFSLDQSYIDVEKLLLRAISCNRYTRLLEVHRELSKNGQICQAAGDVLLQCHRDESDADTKKRESKSITREYGGDEVLRVRAYGSSYITLGINIRSGRFLLQSSRNILTPSTLLECEEALNQRSMSSAEVFRSLRSKSILFLFASIGRFLGLKVYEQGSAAVKIPKVILTGSGLLLMGFPQCGSSYFLLMQLDKDFKPLFELLETQPDPSGRSHLIGDSNHVIRFNKVDIGQMQMLEDELNLSLLDWEKLFSSLPNVGGPIQTSEPSLLSEFGLEASLQIAEWPNSSFPSVVDDMFGIEKGRSPSIKRLSASKSVQDLASLRSPYSVEGVSAIDDDQGRFLNDSSKEVFSGNRSSLLLSPLPPTGPQIPAPRTKPNGLRRSPTVCVAGSLSAAGSSLWSITPVCQAPESGISHSPSNDVLRHNKNPRKRSISDVFKLIPSLQWAAANTGFCKRRKISESSHCYPLASQASCSSDVMCKTEGYTYGNLLAEANKGNAPSSIYVTALLHVVRHCSLCIKHARLTSQMDALDIPYVEGFGLRTPSSNLWFQLPFVRDDSWQHICLRLGRPGSMYWDVKINDQHFRDLWELQKGSTSTPWGCGVRIATTSDIDSHIRYDPEGVILSYSTVEADSIKRLVADLQRLSNAQLFALGMRKLLGKVTVGEKSVVKVAHKISEQMRKAFIIEAVGLTRLWFSFGAGVFARFVIEWESGKEGCTMHVSPDQLWPHTKFLEEFINGSEVASLLDCIWLTAGPLHALTAATLPARAGPASEAPGVTAGPSSIPKQNSCIPSPGLIPSSSTSNVTQTTFATPVGNPVSSTIMGPLGSHSLHDAAMLAVPSSLLPTDVSVVLHGPYWIRIIYRKNFAVDMLCFAGDQVWLQPATPPKGGPAVGGSLQCPQFRPFIMEHVAQELNGLEPNFTGVQQTVGLLNSKSPNPSSGSLHLAANVNRINLMGVDGISVGGIPRSNLVAGLSHLRNAFLASSNLADVSSGMPLRRSPGTGELNTAFIGLGDDGGYDGGWVPIVALKKVLRGILKYFGVRWLFSQLPDLLKEILGSILKENEGALLNLDQEQPALCFFVGGYVFAVSVHRVQLLLQVFVKHFHHQQQQQTQTRPQEELTTTEISEICGYFSCCVSSEPYDASRVASFITLLTLPISVLREFLKLIAWKKGLLQAQGGDIAPAQKPRIELSLENHAGSTKDENSENSLTLKSNIHYDGTHTSVDFGLTVVLDPAHIPHINAAGGAAWLLYCVSVRLRYSFGENPHVSFLGMEGSHGGQACWLRLEEWEKCKQRVARTVETNGISAGDITQGRLRLVADSVQRTLQLCLLGLGDCGGVTASSGAT